MNAITEKLTPLAGKLSPMAERLAPCATDMLRRDHSKVIAAFHRFEPTASPQMKQALVNTICLALEVHAQLEEEIFYPAMRAIDPEVVDKSIPEHAEMRTRIETLRAMDPSGPDYDAALMELMRVVMHHVADEESTLLHHADRMLRRERLDELGAQMMKRRMEIMMPRAGEIARNSANAMSKNTMLLGAGAVLAGAFVIRRLFGR